MGVQHEMWLEFTRPIKGGTFVFRLQMKAPNAPPKNTGWLAYMKGGDTYKPELVHDNFEMLPHETRWQNLGGFMCLAVCFCLGLVLYLSYRLRRTKQQIKALRAQLDKAVG